MSKIIYLVDDEPDILVVMSGLLKGSGYEVKTFASGPELIIALSASQPDLIVLDVLMPDMNGYELCRTIKANPSLSSIKICFLSALDTAEDVKKGIVCGADDFLKKTLGHRHILGRIKGLLGEPDDGK
ncbi:MAG: response regulator [Candidatus Lindowbacteria bacterium]|nr:response regulator [Candidatus Lindowbacteria bacterium]